jgi:hypothetical protein
MKSALIDVSACSLERAHERKRWEEEQPDEIYTPSARRLPSELRRFEYPADCEVRRVRHRGLALLSNKRKIPVGTPLTGEYVGFRWVSEVKWEVLFGPMSVGIFDLRRNQMIGRRYRRQGRKMVYSNTW